MNILNISEDLEKYDFAKSQFIQEEAPKTQIYLHHTAGNSNGFDTFRFWETNQERIATCVTVCGRPKNNDGFRDGQIVQGYSSKFWAYHLGLRESTFQKFDLPYKSLDKTSIGIEICNWGQLTRKEGKFYTHANTVVREEEVTELPVAHRGYKYYHSITDAQIVSVEKLLRHWGKTYGISLEYKEDIWDVCPRALNGESGIFTHNSVRYDKTDISPQPKLIEMLKSL
jgi:hypothetical protein